MPSTESAADAVSRIQSDQRVFVHGGMATPLALIDALVEQADRLRNVEMMHLHTAGEARYAGEEFSESFRVANFFVGGNMRGKLREGVDYVPCFLSEIPDVLEHGRRPDVCLIHVSPPDRHGICTLGTSVDVVQAAISAADTVIAQVNPQMPRVHGDGFLHVDDIDVLVEVDAPIPEFPRPTLGPAERKIGEFAAGLIEDGSTLQMGIGAVPDAVLDALKHHRDLGIHTEMWSNGALDLIRCGAVNNACKSIHPGKTVSGFVMGTRELYDFIDDNPEVVQLNIAYVNRPAKIARNPKVAAINSAVEVDLTGQVCADSIGSHIISGVGGQLDFMRGAHLSPGGKPIIALPSRTKRGDPRIVPMLKPGAGVVTTRCHVHYIITEYGVAYLHGKTLDERARALTGIAHPDDREALESAWHAHWAS